MKTCFLLFLAARRVLIDARAKNSSTAPLARAPRAPLVRGIPYNCCPQCYYPLIIYAQRPLLSHGAHLSTLIHTFSRLAD